MTRDGVVMSPPWTEARLRPAAPEQLPEIPARPTESGRSVTARSCRRLVGAARATTRVCYRDEPQPGPGYGVSAWMPS